MTEDDYFLSSLVERLMKMTKVTNFLNKKDDWIRYELSIVGTLLLNGGD